MRRRQPGQYVKSKKTRLNDDYENNISREDVQSMIDTKVNSFLSESSRQNGVIKLINTDKLIPDFDPDNRDMNVKSWIRKIDQLGDIYNWTELTKSFNLQSKLQGQARVWYNRLDSYDHSWEEWKSMLLKAFPRYHDYATLLDELTSRKKSSNETMTKYYQEKLAMCFRCQLSDQAAVSCIIRGLPLELQANAQAYQCSNPDALYEGFLSAFDHYQPITPVRVSSAKPRVEPSASKGTLERKAPICYRCNETGHVAPNCSLPDKRKCFRCGKIGHVASSCLSQTKQIQMLSNLNDIYKKTAKVNNTYVKAYIDTGSELNVMADAAARALKLNVLPTRVQLRGFGGTAAPALGHVEFDLYVDKVKIHTTAVTTNTDLGDIVLLIGQPVINDNTVSLTVTRTGAELCTTEYGNDINSINTIEESSSYKVQVDADIEVPVGDSLVKVVVEGAPPGELCTKPRQHSIGAEHYAVASTLLRGGAGYLRICNIGEVPLKWKKGETVTRAELCNVYGEVSRNLLFTRRERVIEGSTIHIGGVPLDQINVGNISKIERTELIELLNSHSDCFASSPHELGCTNLGEMHIKTTTDKPINRKPYRLAHSERKIVADKIEEMLESQIIRESTSEYASPILLVRKKNGDFRLCIDYRALNAITVKERFPLPHIEDQLSKLAGKTVFTSLDLYAGYHNIKLHSDSIDKTAFITPDGHYEYLRVPFGLANAPSVFMRVIQKLVKMVGSDELVAFMDDILLSTASVNEGLCLLENVLSKLRKVNLKLNMKKCSFLKSEITFLGHEISAEGIKPGNHKVEAVAKFKTPSNLHELRQFLGLCSYFRKFVAQFATIAKPLTNLTKKNCEWVWAEEQIMSFNTLKNKLCSQPVLALFDPSQACEIHTDASKQGLAGILMQSQGNGQLKPVFYFSRVTSREESFYHSYELETLAVVESLKRFRIYILGKTTKIVTDCSAVRYTLEKKDLIPRIARWWLAIQEYDIQIEHRPGDRMKHVDALSRNPNSLSSNPCDSQNTTTPLGQNVIVNINSISSDDWFLTVQIQDPKLKNIIDQLTSGNACSDVQNNYVIKNNRLFRKTLKGEKLVVPSLARWQLMQKFHDKIGHVGLKRCDELIKSDYWFPKMTRFIKKYVNSCFSCAYSKGEYGKPSGELHPIPKPTVPMDTVHIDHLGPFSKTRKGYQYILVIVDAFSKFLLARPTRTINSVETLEVLKDVFSLFGYPRRIVSDRNLAFTSRIFKQFVHGHHIHHTLNAIACPRANGQVERYNRTLLNAMRTRCIDQNMWTECLPDVVWGINNTLNESIGFHPYELMFSNRSRLLPNLDGNSESKSVVEKRRIASDRLRNRAIAMKMGYDKRHKPEKRFSKGDLVLWKQSATGGEVKSVNTKLRDVYSGPYMVTKVLNNGRYEIRSIQGMRGYKKFNGIVPADSLRTYRSVPSCSESSSDEEVVTRDDLIDLLES